MSTKIKRFTDRVKSLFTRRRPRTPTRSPNSSSVREGVHFYLGTPVQTSASDTRKNTLYIFKATDKQLSMSIKRGESLQGAEVGKGDSLPKMFTTHLNDYCFDEFRRGSNVVDTAIGEGLLVRLNSRNYREAHEEAKQYRANNCKISMRGTMSRTPSPKRRNHQNEWS